MAVSLDNYLRVLSTSYYLKNSSVETQKINGSIASLRSNLSSYFGNTIDRSFVFGSYDRDTILPRKYDMKSDVDVMVVFCNSSYSPETYRNQLKRFADKYYGLRYNSPVVKTFPTITIRLNNINYDLVPAKERPVFWSGTILEIPGSNGWRNTDPNDVKESLIKANTRYKGVVRPLIRLMKAWNCNNGYPYDSYLLELEITNMNFSGDNVQMGLFYIAENLSTGYGDSLSKQNKLFTLKTRLAEVKDALENDNLIRAKIRLHTIFPHTN